MVLDVAAAHEDSLGGDVLDLELLEGLNVQVLDVGGKAQ